jgi:hypothetical protein
MGSLVDLAAFLKALPVLAPSFILVLGIVGALLLAATAR